MSGGGGGERSEKATPKKRKKARRDGQIGNSPEVGAWLGMLAATFVIPHVFRSVMDTGTIAIVQIGATIRDPDPARAMKAATASVQGAFMAVLPMVLLIAAIGIASVVGQGGFNLAPKLLVPKFSRINPLAGIKRMFGPHGVWTLVKSLMKSAALALVVFVSVRNMIPTLMGSGSLPLGALVQVCVSTALRLLRYAAVAGVLMAMADYAVVRKRNNKQLKMTKHEVKEELKSSEGDPRLRSAVRSRQMAMRRNRMMADVPFADVVLVNPTHVAVALRYDPARGAPRIVAKGADHVAARIRKVAEQHRVPMVGDISLARTLYQACDVGQEIPADLYKAVATVLAFIMTLKKRGSAAGLHQVRTLAGSPR